MSDFARLKEEIAAAGFGTITSVTAGVGLSGGGSTGAIALQLQSPVMIANGGTGATNAAAALAALGGVPLVGNPALTADLMSINSSNGFTPQLTLSNLAPDASGPYVILSEGRPGPAASQNGDYLGTFMWKGYGSTNVLINGAASIAVAVSGAPTAGFVPTDMIFNTSSGTETGERMRITAAGVLQVPAGLRGTATNDNAAAGIVGEYVSSNLPLASRVSLTTATAANVTSLVNLPAGDWDVSGNIIFVPNAATLVTEVNGWISTVSATLPTAPNNGAFMMFQNAWAVGKACAVQIASSRISLAAPTTVYLGAQTIFGTNILQAYGFIGARRVR
jgi:hypothetical protein